MPALTGGGEGTVQAADAVVELIGRGRLFCLGRTDPEIGNNIILLSL